MGELLKILQEWLIFFFAEDRYKLTNSKVGSSFGNALIDLSSNSMAWRLVRDRSQIFLDCGLPSQDGRAQEWYSSELVIRLLSGERVESAELTREMARWFEKHLPEIEERFQEPLRAKTLRELKDLKRLRAKEEYG